MNQIKYFLLCAAASLLFASCETDDYTLVTVPVEIISVPAVTNVMALENVPLNSLADTATVGFTINAPSEVTKATVLLSYNGGTPVPATSVSSFPANVSLAYSDILSALGVSKASTAAGDKIAATFAYEASSGPFAGAQMFTMLSAPCVYDATTWAGAWRCDEPGYAIYDVTLSADPADANRLTIDNFWDFGGVVIYVFDPVQFSVTIPSQVTNMGGTDYTVAGTGSFDQCNETFSVNYTVTTTSSGVQNDSNTHTFRKN